MTAFLAHKRHGAGEIAIGTSLAVLTANILKRLVRRQRPRFRTGTPLQSFPSAHSAAATAYLLGAALISPRAYRPVAVAAACAGVAGVNALRIEAREHWATDVLAGDLVGVLGVTVAYLADRRPLRADCETLTMPAGVTP
jgi:membrane-associated phospholipid phosphatase